MILGFFPLTSNHENKEEFRERNSEAFHWAGLQSPVKFSRTSTYISPNIFGHFSPDQSMIHSASPTKLEFSSTFVSHPSSSHQSISYEVLQVHERISFEFLQLEINFLPQFIRRHPTTQSILLAPVKMGIERNEQNMSGR